MTRSVLVATPHPTFGELLRLSLEESGEYQVIHFIEKSSVEGIKAFWTTDRDQESTATAFNLKNFIFHCQEIMNS